MTDQQETDRVTNQQTGQETDQKADNEKTARDVAEGKEIEDLERDPEQDELERASTVPDPEDELLENDDTHYTDENEL